MTETLKLIAPDTGEVTLFSRDGDRMYVAEQEIPEELGREMVVFFLKEGWTVSKLSPASLKDFMAYAPTSEGWIIPLRDAIVRPRTYVVVLGCRYPKCPISLPTISIHEGAMHGVVEVRHCEYGAILYASPYLDHEGQGGIAIMLDSDSPLGLAGDSWEIPVDWSGDVRTDTETWAKHVTALLQILLPIEEE